MTEREEADQPQGHCKNCGAEVRPEDAFCRSCGASLTSGAESLDQTRSPSSEQTPSMNDVVKEKFRGVVQWVKTSPASLGGSPQSVPQNLLRRFKNLPIALRVTGVVVGALLLLTVLSPLGFILAALLFGAGLIGLILRIAQRRSVKGWGIVVVGSLVFVFVFAEISDVLYGTGFVQCTGSSVGTGPKSGSTNSDAKGSSKASDTEDLKPGERRYLQRTAEISWEIAKITSRQVELYNLCLQLCVPQPFNEMHQNMERSSKLLEDAKALAPPAGYEQSYDAFTSGVQTDNELVQRIPLFSIGGAEGDSLSTKAAAHFARAHDLAPERGQRFYEEYGRSHPVPNA